MKQIPSVFFTTRDVRTREVGSKRLVFSMMRDLSLLYICSGLHRSSLLGDVEAGVGRTGLEIVQRCVGGISSSTVPGSGVCNCALVIFFGRKRPLACLGGAGFRSFLGMEPFRCWVFFCQRLDDCDLDAS